MFRKIAKSLTNNLGLKILSVLFAVALWLVVVNFDDPNMTKPFSVPVTVLNQEIIEEMGKVYDVVNESDTAVFYVTGKRSAMERLKATDFKATADLSQVDLQMEGDVKYVPIEVTANDSRLSITRKTINLQITIEDLSEKTLQIAVNTQGEPASGYAIGEKTVAPNLLTISGPQSVVSQVSSVSAVVNVDGVYSDIVDDVIPILYDDRGKVIESDRIKMNLAMVNVEISVWRTKEVPVICQVSGEPADGYQYTGIEFAPETLLIKGEPEILNTITEIPIPEDAINLDGATGNVENTIDITPYLDEGVSLVDESSGKIAVKAIVEALETKTLELPVASIKVENLDNDQYKLEFGAPSVNVQVRGLGNVMESLTVGALQATIDASDFNVDTVDADVSVTLGEGYELVGTVSVKVHVIDKDAQQDGTNGAGGDLTGTGGNAGTGGTVPGTGSSGGTPGTGGGNTGSSGGGTSGDSSGESGGTSGETGSATGGSGGTQDNTAKPDSNN